MPHLQTTSIKLNVTDLPEAVPHECRDKLKMEFFDTTKANGHDDISAQGIAMSITPAVTQLFHLTWGATRRVENCSCYTYSQVI